MAAHANDLIAREKFDEVASELLLVWAVGAIIGAMIGAPMTLLFGIGGFFLTTPLCHAVLCWYAVFRLTQSSAVPIEDRVVFKAAVRMGQAVLAVNAMETANWALRRLSPNTEFASAQGQ